MDIFILEKKKAKISCNDELAALKKIIESLQEEIQKEIDRIV